MIGPTSYGKSPVEKPPGSLGASMEKTMAGIDKNLSLLQASISSIIATIKVLEGKIPQDLSTRVNEIRNEIASIETNVEDLSEEGDALASKIQDCVSLVAAGGGSSWNLADLSGYPNVRAVVIDNNSESNTLNLPAMGSEDRLCVSVKVTSGSSGSLTLDGGAADIFPISAMGVGATYSLPAVFTEGSLTITEYGVTLIWSGTEWQIIETANYLS